MGDKIPINYVRSMDIILEKVNHKHKDGSDIVKRDQFEYRANPRGFLIRKLKRLAEIVIYQPTEEEKNAILKQKEDDNMFKVPKVPAKRKIAGTNKLEKAQERTNA